MTREEAIKILRELLDFDYTQALEMAIKTLEQESRKDEVILTNKEYRELISNEYDIGYCKGYINAQEEQAAIIDKMRAEIEEHTKINQNLNTDRARALCWCLDVIDKYKASDTDESDAEFMCRVMSKTVNKSIADNNFTGGF